MVGVRGWTRNDFSSSNVLLCVSFRVFELFVVLFLFFLLLLVVSFGCCGCAEAKNKNISEQFGDHCDCSFRSINKSFWE